MILSFSNIVRLLTAASKQGVAGPQFGHVAKTASYTLVGSDLNKIFSTTGAAGAVTFTLPAPATELAGAWVLFVNAVDQDMTIAAATVDTLIAFNDLTADSVAFSTSSEKIAGMILAICNGTKWIVAPLSEETQTLTVAT